MKGGNVTSIHGCPDSAPVSSATNVNSRPPAAGSLLMIFILRLMAGAEEKMKILTAFGDDA
jgi:hypothetical protein